MLIQILNQLTKRTPQPEVLDGYFPPEIIGKTYYFDLFDFVNRLIILAHLDFDNKVTEIFYTDNSLSEINRSDEYSVGNFVYYENRNLIFEQNYDDNKYIIPANKQGVYTKKIK